MTVTEVLRDYRVRVHDAGTTTPTDLTVDFTITLSEMADIPTFPAQEVDVLAGTAASLPGRVSVADTASFLTPKLADSGGRMVLLRRLAEFQTNTDAAGWVTQAIGRITSIALDPNRAIYNIDVQDERHIERTTTIWTNTATDFSKNYHASFLIPPSIDRASNGVQYGRHAFFSIQQVSHNGVVDGNLVRVIADKFWLPNAAGIDGFTEDHENIIGSQAVEQIKRDLKAGGDQNWTTSTTSGNFTTTKARVNGSDYPLFGFGADRPSGPVTALQQLDDIVSGLINRGQLYVWIVAPGYGAGVGTTECLIYQPDHEPTEVSPLFVGGRGMDPITLAKNLLTDAGVRIDTTQFAALENTGYPRVRFKVTGPANLASELEEKIWRPNAIVPLINQSGEVSPRSVAMPTGDEIPDINSLTNLTDSTVTPDMPDWGHAAMHQVTRLEVEILEEFGQPIGGQFGQILGSVPAKDRGVVQEFPVTISRDHDRIAQFGTHVHRIEAHGLHEKGVIIFPPTFDPSADPTFTGAQRQVEYLARLVFDRFGDGAIIYEGEFNSAAAAEFPGDFVRLTTTTTPSPQDQSRGTTRVAQALSRQPRSATYHLVLLDAGPNSQALSAPTLSLAQNGKHAINATISGLPAGAGYVLQFARSVSQPAAQSELWQAVGQGSAAETTTISDLPSNTTYWGRARSVAQNRISSVWSTADSATTQALTAPSGLADSNVTGTTAEFNWTNGETDYDIEFLVDAAACAGATPVRVATLMAGSTSYDLEDLDLSTTHCAGVRHRDSFGGVSSTNTHEFTTTATAPICPDPADIVIL